MQHNLIHELMLYKFKLSHYVTKPTKNICMGKVKVQLMKVQLADGSRNFAQVAIRQGQVGPKILDSEVILQITEANWQVVL